VSRLFDGVDDQIVFPAPAAMDGTLTMLVVVKFATASGWASLIEMENSGGADRATIGRNPTLSNNLYWSNGIAALLTGGETMTSTTEWLVLGITKTAGTTTPRAHKCIVGGANSHTDQTGTIADAGTSVGGVLRLGGNADWANIRLAAAAIWHGTALTDADFNSINAALTTQSIFDLSPTWLVDDADAFTADYVGSADQTSITGTTDDADDPAGWVYGLGSATTYPSALLDFTRNAFPFLIGDGRIEGRGRPSSPRESGGPGPLGGFERYIFPRLHPEFATGGITYNKLGDLIAGLLAAGDDVFEATEAGSLTPDTTVSGADVFEHVEAGALIAGTILAGADVFTAAETGSLTPATFIAGTGTKAAEKAGSLVVGVFTAGADAFTAAETGTISTAGQLRGADVFESTETGSLTTGAHLRGADVFTAAETGSITPAGFIAGPDASTFNRLGSVTTGALLSGVAAKVGSYVKAGSLTVSVLLSGPDVSTFNRLGSITPDTSLSGGKIREKTKAGSTTTAGQLRGADVFTAVETGSLTPAAFVLGGRNVTLNRTGALTITVLLEGPSSYVPFLVVPIPAGWLSSGRTRVLTRGTQGRIDQPEQGVIT
jgi:hypothetical protein